MKGFFYFANQPAPRGGAGRRRVKRSENEKGYALISVLLTAAVMSVIAAALISQSRISMHIEKNAQRRLEAEMIAEAAMTHAILTLLAPSGSAALRSSDTPIRFSFDGVDTEILIQDELGKIDINASGDDALPALIRAAGGSLTQSIDVRANIKEWRLFGEPKPDQQSTAAGPRFNEFHSVEELLLIEGMTDLLFEKLRPGITVHSHSGAIDPAVATDLVLRAFPGMKRSKSGVSQPTRSPGFLTGRAFTIDVALQTDQSPLHFQTIIRLTGDPREPYWILERRGF